MFTGIVEETGIIKDIRTNRDAVRMSIKADIVCRDTKIGDSISIDGVCLTVVDIKRDILSFDIVSETVKHTTLKNAKTSNRVNMERSLRAYSRLGGHFVSGHVDYAGRILESRRDKDGVSLKIDLPGEYAPFVAKKGSVALNGVSLTAGDVSEGSFTVYLIPHTLNSTTLNKNKQADLVNVETDILAKYTAKQNTKKTDIQSILKKHDYIQ